MTPVTPRLITTNLEDSRCQSKYLIQGMDRKQINLTIRFIESHFRTLDDKNGNPVIITHVSGTIYYVSHIHMANTL